MVRVCVVVGVRCGGIFLRWGDSVWGGGIFLRIFGWIFEKGYGMMVIYGSVIQ